MRLEQEVKESGIDRRVFSRMRLTFALTYRANTDNLLYRAYCRDMGPGGIGILTDKRLSPDTKIELWLDTRDSSPLYVTGKVVWSRWEQTRFYKTYRTGIQFDQIKFFHLDRLAE